MHGKGTFTPGHPEGAAAEHIRNSTVQKQENPNNPVWNGPCNKNGCHTSASCCSHTQLVEGICISGSDTLKCFSGMGTSNEYRGEMPCAPRPSQHSSSSGCSVVLVKWIFMSRVPHILLTIQDLSTKEPQQTLPTAACLTCACCISLQSAHFPALGRPWAWPPE